VCSRSRTSESTTSIRYFAGRLATANLLVYSMGMTVMLASYDVHPAAVDSIAIDRAEALDAWLRARLGAPWDALLDSWNCRVSRGACRKSLYRFHLLANGIARVAMSPNGGMDLANRLEDWGTRPLEEVLPLAEEERASFALVADHPVIADDLASAWHPQFEGRSLAGWPASHICIGFSERFEAAMDLLGCAPALQGLVRSHCAAVCILKADPPEERGTCISLTSKSVPGLVYMSDIPLILTAEALVHESAHLCLAGWEQLLSLYSEPDRLVNTPLRSDPRPVSGLMHQVFVLVRLAELYDALSSSQSDSVNRNRAQVEKRRGVQRSDMLSGLSALETCTSSLTPKGIELLRALQERAGGRS